MRFIFGMKNFLAKLWQHRYVVLALLLVCDATMAASTVTVASIATNVRSTVSSLATILQDVAIVAGIGFVLASFFKFHQHKLNPTQVPMSQGITLLIIGAGLTLFPVLLPTAGSAVVGTGQSFGSLSATALHGIIGGAGSST